MALTSAASSQAAEIISSVNIYASNANTLYYTVPSNCYLEGNIFLNPNGSSFTVLINGVPIQFGYNTTNRDGAPNPIVLSEGDTIATTVNQRYWCFSGVLRSKA